MICKEARDGIICYFEGYLKRLKDGTDRVVPYRCPAGVPTIGYGSTWRRDGSAVRMTDGPMSHAEALELMDRELRLKCEPAVNRLITVRLHPFMYGAVNSFTYNLGAGHLQSSNLRKVINAKRWDAVTAEFAKWRMADGKILQGLVRRRAAEAALFMRGVAELEAGRAANDDAPGSWVTTIQRTA